MSNMGKLITFCLVLAVFQLAVATESRPEVSTPILQLKNGPIRGLIKDVDESSGKVEFYQGLQYGTADRFQLPQLVNTSSSEVYNATSIRSACPQFGLIEMAKKMMGNVSEAEECLYLNVWRPAEEKANRSVMVWIHGGAFELGTIFTAMYDGQHLASSGDVIVVSIAYRLGPFGFMNGPGITPNLGLHDQILALKWIQENIASFGGNPNSVTIFGESAGSISVGALVLSPLASGLFQRAIAQSGAPNRQSITEPLETSLVKTQKFAERLNCSVGGDLTETVLCIKGKSIDELQTASMNDFMRAEFFAPVFGDSLLPLRPNDALVAGKFNPVDYMYGITRDEGSMFLGFFFPELLNQTTNLTVTEAKEYIVKLMKVYGEEAMGAEVADFYIDRLVNATQDDLKIAISAAWGDTHLGCPSVLFGEELARNSPSSKHIYAYRLMQTSKASKSIIGLPQPEWMGVTHGADIGYLFLPQVMKSTPALFEVSQKMIQAWTAFAKTGMPTVENAVWTEAVNRETGDFSTRHFHLEASKFTMVEGTFKDVCERFWKPKF